MDSAAVGLRHLLHGAGRTGAVPFMPALTQVLAKAKGHGAFVPWHAKWVLGVSCGEGSDNWPPHAPVHRQPLWMASWPQMGRDRPLHRCIWWYTCAAIKKRKKGIFSNAWQRLGSCRARARHNRKPSTQPDAWYPRRPMVSSRFVEEARHLQERTQDGVGRDGIHSTTAKRRQDEW